MSETYSKEEMIRARKVWRAVKEGSIKTYMNLYGWDRKRALAEWVKRGRESQ